MSSSDIMIVMGPFFVLLLGMSIAFLIAHINTIRRGQ
jgi:hypothetical protein